MKRAYPLLLFSMFVAMMCSCEQKEFEPAEWAITPELELSESGIVASSMPENHVITVKTNYQKFSVSSEQSWCTAIADVPNRTVNIHVDANDGVDQRAAVVTVQVSRGSKSLSKDFTVYQIGGRWDMVEGTDIKLRWSYDISESQKKIISDQLRQLARVDGGTFIMGSQNTDETAPNYYRWANEYNWVREVTLSNYYIGKYEVTQEQWAAIMTTSPSHFIGSQKPVENITWTEAQEYVKKLSDLTGLIITLPTSAQWEYAARGGKHSMGFLYAGSDNYDEVAHSVDISIAETSPQYTTANVGTKKPNELGLYDMTGNVSELCSDWYGKSPKYPQTDPIGPSSSTTKAHVDRGGDFTSLSIRGVVYYVYPFNRTTSLLGSLSFAGIRIVMTK